MATKARNLSRVSLRKEQVREIQWSPEAEPSPELLRMPGFKQWHAQMQLVRNRDIESINRAVANTPRFLTIEVRTDDPANPVDGQIWIRVDLI